MCSLGVPWKIPQCEEVLTALLSKHSWNGFLLILSLSLPLLSLSFPSLPDVSFALAISLSHRPAMSSQQLEEKG